MEGVRGDAAEGLRRVHAPLVEGLLDDFHGAHLLQPLVAEEEGAAGPQALQLVGDRAPGPRPRRRILVGSLNS